MNIHEHKRDSLSPAYEKGVVFRNFSLDFPSLFTPQLPVFITELFLRNFSLRGD